MPNRRPITLALLLGLTACQPDGDSTLDGTGTGTGTGASSSEESSSGESSSEESSSEESSSEESSSEESSSEESSGEETTEGLEPPEPAVLDLELSRTKQFDFAWSPALGAEDYQLLEQATPDAEWVEVGPQTMQTGLSLTVALHLRADASYLVRACNDAGCTDSEPVEVSGTLVAAVGYFKASNTDADDRFGLSVALSADGSTLAVGAQSEDSDATGIDGDQTSNATPSAGAVYIYTREGMGSWTQQAYLKASNAGGGDGFGNTVALSEDGNTLAVTAQYEGSSATGVNGDQADDSADNAGAAYVFTRTGVSWTQEAYIKASNTAGNDAFGGTMALSADGDTLAVGARLEGSNATGIDGDQSDNTMPAAGAVYVYAREGMGSWAQQAYVKASNTNQTDLFGVSVGLSADGSTLAVGAFRERSAATGVGGDQTDNSVVGAGAVYVFTRANTNWSQEAYIKASNTGTVDFFGSKLALSAEGDTLAVGAYRESSGAPGVNGDQADDSIEAAGAAYVFTRAGMGVWTQEAYIKASNPAEDNRFGTSVALAGDGNTLAVGATQEASGVVGLNGDQINEAAPVAGAAYVFLRDEMGDWAQEAYVKAPNTNAEDWFGASTALTDDGGTLAVGAIHEDSNVTGVNGDQANNTAQSAGAVYLY